jgi:hypothetical protein
VVSVNGLILLALASQYPPGTASKNEKPHHSRPEPPGLTKDGAQDLYQIEFPDASSWLFSGFVTNIAPQAPDRRTHEPRVMI